MPNAHADPGFASSLPKRQRHFGGDHIAGVEGTAALLAAAGCVFPDGYCPTCRANWVWPAGFVAASTYTWIT